MICERFPCPAMRAVQCLALICKRFVRRRTFIKGENNVRADIVLDLDRAGWGEVMLGAIEVRDERHAHLVDVRDLRSELLGSFWQKGRAGVGILCFRNFRNILSVCSAERENLKSSRVCHCGARPVHCFMQAAHLFDHMIRGLKIEVVCVCENDLCTDVLHLFRGERFHCCLGSYHDKSWRLDVAVLRAQNSRASKRAGHRIKLLYDLEIDWFLH